MQPEPSPDPNNRVFMQVDGLPLMEFYRWKSRLRLMEARAREMFAYVTLEEDAHDTQPEK